MALWIGIPKFETQFQPVQISEALTDEIEALNAIYGDGVLEIIGAANKQIRAHIRIPGADDAVQVRLPLDYPAKPPMIHSIDTTLHQAAALQTKKTLLLYHTLLAEVFISGDVCLFDWVERTIPYLECMTKDSLDFERANEVVPQFDATAWRWMARRTFPTMDLTKTFECTICFDEVHTFRAVLMPCNHYFCIECIAAGWDSAIANMEPFTCCLERIPVEIIQDTFPVDATTIRRYMRMLLERDIEYPFFCGVMKCNELIGSYNEKQLKRGSVRAHGIRCQFCKTFTCTKCLQPMHRGAPCITDHSLNVLIQEIDIRRCPKCHNGIEKNGGCAHMHCRACNSHWWWGEDGSMRPLSDLT